MFNTFIITIADVVKSITLTDFIRAFGDESINLYYQSNPEIIKAFLQMFNN